MTSSVISNGNEISSSYLKNNNDDQNSSQSDWFEFVREHSRARPIVPGSDFLLARSCASSSSYSTNRTSTVKKDSERDSHKKESEDGQDIIEITPSTSERWSKIRHRQLKSSNSTWSGTGSTPPSFAPSPSFNIAKEKNPSGSPTLKSYGFSHGERNMDPMLWSFADNPRDAQITVHRPVSFSPGPKYALEPIVMNSRRRHASEDDTFHAGRSIFSREPRMMREPPRSPGPKYHPIDPKGVASQNRIGAPRLHAQGRTLLGSPYYEELTSSGTTAIYDIMGNFDIESKRLSQKNVFLGRPSTDGYDKSPPLKLNSRA